jgi:hypothetical protein
MSADQYNLFQKDDPYWMELKSIESKQDNLRKGIFQRYSSLMQYCQSMQQEIYELREELRKLKKEDFSDLELFAKK